MDHEVVKSGLAWGIIMFGLFIAAGPAAIRALISVLIWLGANH